MLMIKPHPIKKNNLQQGFGQWAFMDKKNHLLSVKI